MTTAGKSRPTTAGNKIRTQANALVEKLTRCTPHYIRCIKPNETKKPRDWEEQRVRHQVEYLGLKENVRVRRAGFAYRRPFQKFLFRYGILTNETKREWRGDQRAGVELIMSKMNIKVGQYQLGLTKVFIKAPETLFMLEEQRERKYNYYARIIQKAFKKYFARRRYEMEKQEATNVVFGKKQRRENSINRNFVGDYIGLDCRPILQALVGRREKIHFAEVVKKYDRTFKPFPRDLLLTGNSLFLIGREQIKKGKDKGTYQEVVKRKIEFENISAVSLSPYQDDFVVIHVKENYDSLLEIVFKTEFLSCFNKNYQAKMGRSLNVKFSNSLEFRIKKEGWGGGGTRRVNFALGSVNKGCNEILKSSGKTLTVTVPSGLPNTSRPSAKRVSRRVMNRTDVGNRFPKEPSRIIPTYPASHQPTVQRAAPPPPSEPAPPNQPVVAGFRLPSLRPVQMQLRKSKDVNPDMPFMKTPQAGAAGVKRASLKDENRNLPALARPRPPLKPKPIALAKCKASYEYTAQDLDELSFKEGDIIDIVKEHEGGWWEGRLRGKDGLFPANYVERL